MQNIDPVTFVQPGVAVAITIGALIFWWYRKGFRGLILVVSALAYFLAIASKTVIQLLTADMVVGAFGRISIVTGVYLGLQTVFLEVGLAYLFVLYVAKRRTLNPSDAVPYGLSLSFWENGVLLGLYPILQLVVLYLLFAGGSNAATTAYNQLLTTNPSVFLPPAKLLPLVLIGLLERISSMLVHLAWGMLCVFSVVYGRRRYLAYALPMGLVDALVPFAGLNVIVFEAGLFILSLLFLLVALIVARETKSNLQSDMPS